MITLTLILNIIKIQSVPIKIRLANSERYLRGSDGEENIVHLSDHSKSDNYNYIWDDTQNEYLYLRIENHLEKGLQYDMQKDSLVLAHAISGEPEQFRIIPVNIYNETYWIVSDRRCITYVEQLKKFVLSECFENDENQHFNIILQGEYNTELPLLSSYKEIEVHSSPNFKNYLKMAHSNDDITETKMSQDHMENDARDLVQNVFKFLYDMSLCFNENEICKRGGFLRLKKSASLGSFKSRSYSSYKKSSSQSSYRSSSQMSSRSSSSRSSRSFSS
ncbi:hypothetical protein EDEG_03512 [Edhazardia aedis USNM 41457]|uniref:Uncharacterized protein n=1 Tax=Edhazardia aedis (strain USNM 41457) TaxID=1003232 RepID=J9D2I0_EDHAE|nr:hypothetical protein EDEG_03512 [Edhazardia aedis USNM 41457]|eukprot:EJW02036.1 hypothetical protein EDEG_03512 [Edhazardia aedis USNM 41457]